MGINLKAISQIQSDIQSIKPDADLLIVTKNQSIDDIQKLINLENFKFGENKVQEAKRKFFNFSLRDKLELHLIGRLQSNKVEEALNIFDVIQSIDRKKIVDEIVNVKNKFKTIKTKFFFIQVNIGNEAQKSGVNEMDLLELHKYCLQNQIIISGLMCIPPNDHDSKKYFIKMNELKNKIDPKLILSMGMSSDYKEALIVGSNLIRVGSIIFND